MAVLVCEYPQVTTFTRFDEGKPVRRVSLGDINVSSKLVKRGRRGDSVIVTVSRKAKVEDLTKCG